jgi:hypothetical protein
VYTLDVSWGRGQSADWMRTDMRFGDGRRHVGTTHTLASTHDMSVEEVAEVMVESVSIAIDALALMLPELEYVNHEEFEKLVGEKET